MNNIKNATEYWKEFKQEAIDMIKNGEDDGGELEKQVPMCDLAIQALEEKQERECNQKLCGYCVALNHLTKASHRNAYKYCPMCSKEVKT